MRLAVIDMGTNTFHLLIADGVDKILYKTTVPVLLGQGRINQNMILPEAMERGIRTLTQFKATINQYQVDAIKAVATSAVRSAINGHEFVALATAIGIHIDVITGEAEADYIFNGVMATGLIQQTTLVMDIGGGSTEFIICNPQGALWKKSYNIGAARLMQAYFHSDPLSEKEHQDIIHHLDNTLGDLKTACDQYKPSLLVGSAGAFESFAALLNDGNEIGDVASANLDIERYKAVSKRLIASTHEERAGMKGLISLRVDMIVMAAIITDYILARLNLHQLSLSTYDLKMGVLAKNREYQRLEDAALELIRHIDPSAASFNEQDVKQVIEYIDTMLSLGGDQEQLEDQKFSFLNFIVTFSTDEKIREKYKNQLLVQARKCIDKYLTKITFSFQADRGIMYSNQIGWYAYLDETDNNQLELASAYMKRFAHLAEWHSHAYFKNTYARLLLKLGRIEDAYQIISSAPAADANFNQLRTLPEIMKIAAARQQAYKKVNTFNYPNHPQVKQHADVITLIRERMYHIKHDNTLKLYTTEQIEQFEQSSGMILPDEYKVYLMEIGSGGAGVFFADGNIPGLEEISTTDKEKIFIGRSGLFQLDIFVMMNSEVWSGNPKQGENIVEALVPATSKKLKFLAFIAGSLDRSSFPTEDWI